MLKVHTPQISVTDTGTSMPDVFIELIEIENAYNHKKITIHYSIEDSSGEWVKNSYLTDQTYLYIFCNDVKKQENLTSIKRRNVIVDGKIHSTEVFYLSDLDNLTITAYCGNEYLIGTKIVEKIIDFGSIVPATYENNTYKYINKILDMRLLERGYVEISQEMPSLRSFNTPLFVSDTTNKRSVFGFVVDIEKYLESNSKSYNILKKIPQFKANILKNSDIISDSIQFYKKNINIPNSDYVLIETTPVVYNDSDSVYIICAADDNNDPQNYEKYSLKVKLSIKDKSQALLNNNLLVNFNRAKAFILKYKEIFDITLSDSSIKDKKTYIFETFYETYLEEIKESVRILSDIYSFYTNIEKNHYESLFVTIFNPLSTNSSIFEKLLISILRLEVYLNSLLVGTDTSTDPIYSVEYNFKESEYGKTRENLHIDYNYEQNYGYEVMSIDGKDIRYAEYQDSLALYTNAEKNVRSMFEINKYYSAESVSGSENLSHFSISYIDLGENSYNLINDYENESLNQYNEIFVRLNEINNFSFNYDTLHSYYYQLLGNNVYIKNIAARRNSSPNSLQVSTIFDENISSRLSSLKYIMDTGIDSLYYLLDDNKLLVPPTNIFQSGSSVYKISDEDEKKPELKSKFISVYNTFFLDRPVYIGNNYNIYRLEESCLNNLYKKKLKLFNQYYILEKTKFTKQLARDVVEYAFADELLFNIPTKYLNRSTENSTINLTLEEI